MNLDKLEALADAATPGPWIFSNNGYVCSQSLPEIVCSPHSCLPNNAKVSDHIKDVKRTGKFIAAANPETIKALIALCRMQHEVVENADALRHESTDFSIYLKRVKMVAEMANEALTAFEQFGKEVK
jgi:transaldolase